MTEPKIVLSGDLACFDIRLSKDQTDDWPRVILDLRLEDANIADTVDIENLLDGRYVTVTIAATPVPTPQEPA